MQLLAEHPVGTGAYILREWRRDDRARVARAPRQVFLTRPIKLASDIIVQLLKCGEGG